jgi:uncharacterized protein (DUF4415 family)
MKKKIARRTSAQLTALRRAGKSQTDWARIRAMRDADIDFSDSSEITPDMFAKAIVQRGEQPVYRKTQLTLRVDRDVVDWFKGQGRGYQTRINALLRAYKEAHGKAV